MHRWFIHVCTYVYMDIAPHCSSGKGSSRRWEEQLQRRTKSRPRVIPRCPNYTGAEGLDQPAARFWEKKKKRVQRALAVCFRWARPLWEATGQRSGRRSTLQEIAQKILKKGFIQVHTAWQNECNHLYPHTSYCRLSLCTLSRIMVYCYHLP